MEGTARPRPSRRDICPDRPQAGRLLRPTCLALLLLSLLASALPAAVITVDGFDSTVADDGVCTLREAITAANTDTASGTTPGECPPGSGADRIVLDGDVSLTVVDHGGTDPTGLPWVSSVITLDGNGHTIERGSGAPVFRFLEVAADSGDLTIADAILSNGNSIAGGALQNFGSTSLIRSTVSGSSATVAGGGIANATVGRLTLIESTVSGCSSPTGVGGGLANEGEALLIDTAVSANSASGGGGINNASGSLTLIRSTISGNTSTGWGGGILNWGTSSLVNSTVSGNGASQGGGVASLFGAASLTHCTIAGNSASESGGAIRPGGIVTLTSSLIANSTGGNCSGIVVDNGHNLADDTSCGAIPGTLTGLDATLDDHSGATLTHALLPGSNAIDAGGSCDLPIDQRGALRDDQCDPGAYEYAADDRYELSGYFGDDDRSSGHHIQRGRVERHLHSVDEDWIWFDGLPSETYEITTSNLLGPADTVIELWGGTGAICDTKLDENDDEAPVLLSSRITYTYTESTSRPLCVVIKEYGGGYSASRGYDVSVDCVGLSCSTCRAGGGNTFLMDSERIFGHRIIEACLDIELSDTVVEPGGTAVLRSGDSVELKDGFQVRAGGSLVVEIDPNLLQ
jgi:CSLREA domain-containing protein